MIIGIILSGVIAGLVATVGALLIGFPLWAAVVLYPVIGVAGAMGFVAAAFDRKLEYARGFAAEYR